MILFTYTEYALSLCQWVLTVGTIELRLFWRRKKSMTYTTNKLIIILLSFLIIIYYWLFSIILNESKLLHYINTHFNWLQYIQWKKPLFWQSTFITITFCLYKKRNRFQYNNRNKSMSKFKLCSFKSSSIHRTNDYCEFMF